MNISVYFYGVQRKMLRQDRVRITLDEEACVSDLLQNIRNTYPGLNLNENAIMITVNDRISELNQKITRDDSISIIPHMGGG
jgi:molybdopterin converting factor small subunit